MTPRWNAAARGAFYGITSSHTKAHFARAVLEGTAFAMRDVIDRLTALGIDTGNVRVMGGGAASVVWTQIRADLLGRPVDALEGSDASAVGAAIIAAVAGGAYPTIAEASATLPLSLRRIEPNLANMTALDNGYVRYRRLFDALEPMFTAEPVRDDS
jgi:xylulokinase